MTPTPWELRNKLLAILTTATHGGKPYVDVESGNLFSQVGGDPKSNLKMPIEMGRRLGVDHVDETNEFVVSMTRHAVADHFAIEHAQCGEQCGRADALVVVRHGLAAPLLDRQSRLGTIECLDLAFLIDAQEQDLSRGLR